MATHIIIIILLIIIAVNLKRGFSNIEALLEEMKNGREERPGGGV